MAIKSSLSKRIATPKRGGRNGRNLWPNGGLIVYIPPRRLGTINGERPKSYRYSRFAKDFIVGEGTGTIDQLPRVPYTVLAIAAEDVLLTEARVPPLTGARLREALPNLIEDKALSDISTLHVAAGAAGDVELDEPEEGDLNAVTVLDAPLALAVIDRIWLRSILDEFAAAGHRVVMAVPESLCIPLEANAWAFARTLGPGGYKSTWVTIGPQQAFALPENTDGARAMLEGIRDYMLANGRVPQAIDVYAPRELAGEAAGIAQVLNVELRMEPIDPVTAWLEQGGPQARFGNVISLLQHDFARPIFGTNAFARWRRAAWLLVAIAAVHIAGLQLTWSQLRSERQTLRTQMEKTLKTAFPSTTVIQDAPLQMSRALADMRSQVGRSDPSDFTSMVVALNQMTDQMPSNNLRGLDYDAHVLKIRFAPGMINTAEDRERVTRRAMQAGYELRFDGAVPGTVGMTNPGMPYRTPGNTIGGAPGLITPTNAGPEVTATMRVKAAS